MHVTGHWNILKPFSVWCKMSIHPLLLYEPLPFLLVYINHIMLYKTLSYHFHTLCISTLLTLWFIYCTAIMVYINVHFYVFIYYYYYHPLGVLYIFIYLKSSIPLSFYANHTTQSYNNVHAWCMGLAYLHTILCMTMYLHGAWA